MNKILKGIVFGCFVLAMPLAIFAQEGNKQVTPHASAVVCQRDCCKGQNNSDSNFTCPNKKAAVAQETGEAYDPLIPQQFVFDEKNSVYAAINPVENNIYIIKHQGNELVASKKILVDVFEGRHDVEKIYRPQGIAIYENHIVFLATHRDSCYLSVLNLEGNEKVRLYFKGRATAFSYGSSAKELRIAGQNDLGFDLVVLSTKNGIEKISSDDAASMHYQKPRKADEIRIADPYGAGMAAVAMSVVFLGLLLLTVIFASTGKALTSFQNFKAMLFAKKHKKPATGAAEIVVKSPSSISGEEYAAIAAAIYMYNSELHDEENTVLTLQKTTRTWTPWNAKFFGMNTYFTKTKR